MSVGFNLSGNGRSFPELIADRVKNVPEAKLNGKSFSQLFGAGFFKLCVHVVQLTSAF